jgi:hypothetical protein
MIVKEWIKYQVSYVEQTIIRYTIYWVVENECISATWKKDWSSIFQVTHIHLLECIAASV